MEVAELRKIMAQKEKEAQNNSSTRAMKEREFLRQNTEKELRMLREREMFANQVNELKALVQNKEHEFNLLQNRLSTSSSSTWPVTIFLCQSLLTAMNSCCWGGAFPSLENFLRGIFIKDG